MNAIKRWMSRALLGDVLLAVAAITLIVIASRIAAVRQVPPRHPLDLPAYILMVIAAAALLVRRPWPLATLAGTTAAAVAYLGIGYPYGPVLLTLWIAMFGVATRLPARRSILACGVSMAAILVPELSGVAPERLWLEAPPVGVELFGLLLAPWGAGALIRLRREYMTRARDEEARIRAYEERLRIAREVHDVVAHGLAVINMQAGVGLHVLDRRPDKARVALGAIREASKHALDDLRGTLAVLRQPDDATGPMPPWPGLGRLEELVEGMRESGLCVNLAVTGEGGDLPAHVDMAAYRIVQESLTNVLRHAGKAEATVCVDRRAHGVALEITDDGKEGPSQGASTGGHGIAGMRERALSVGGSFEAGPRPEGGFCVRARLPIAEPPS
ncbi:MAG TPA: sensor histidine kinase [Candidatus Dormibacteraeota bacterium]|nr:sensor histidine kinase [Candidatus Dormibacteraeota bacterium]